MKGIECMKLTKQPSPPLPKTLKDLLVKQPRQDEPIPGFLVDVGGLLKQNPLLYQSISGMDAESVDRANPCLVISPDQVSSIFTSDEELDLIKAIGGWVAKQIHPNLKIAYDVVWLVYGANELRKTWGRPDRDKISCFFKVAGLALKTTTIIGSGYPNLKVPDHWSNGINFVVKGGNAFYQGKTPPINEMILSTDKRLDIPLKLLKVFGVALDPEFPNITLNLLSAKKDQKKKGGKVSA
jgi:hypothetical protein